MGLIKLFSTRGPATLSASEAHRARLQVSIWVFAAMAAVIAANLKTMMFISAVISVSLGAGSISLRVFGNKSLIDISLIAWTIAVSYLSINAEVMSLFGVLGQPRVWLVCCFTLGVVGIWVWPGLPRQRWRRSRKPLILSMASLVVALFLLHLMVAFILTWFTGINVYDSISTYLPQAVNYLKQGTFTDDSIRLSYLPYLHVTLVLFTLVFLDSDILVNMLSWVFAIMAALCLFAFARRLRWRGWLPWVAALSPLSMPVILMHASASNFDLLVGQWLLFSLYFLRRAFPAASIRWALAAAAATGLALATKPTFWYAAPGLGVLWIVTLVRSFRRRSIQHTVILALTCGLTAGIVGAAFLIRNRLERGFFITPPALRQEILGPASGVEGRAKLLVFNSLARGYQLLTPPFLMPESLALRLDALWVSGIERLGFRLPDPRFTVHQTKVGLIRHASERYHSDHAYFGTSFLLVIVPSICVVLFTRRLLRWQRAYARAAIMAGAMYFITIGLVSRYTVHDGRWLVEMVLLLAVVSPAMVSVLPRRLAGAVSILIAAIAIAEVNDLIRHQRAMPVDRVAAIPRNEQYYRLFGEKGLSTIAAVRLLNLKYPASEFARVFLTKDDVVPPLYAYTGPTGLREAREWDPPTGVMQVPGLVVTTREALAVRFMSSPSVYIDRLSEHHWALIPNDRFRLYFTVRRDHVDSSEDRLLLRAAVAPGMYRQPVFRLLVIQSDGKIIRSGVQRDPQFVVVIGRLTRPLIKAEVREAGTPNVGETYWLSPDRYDGL